MTRVPVCITMVNFKLTYHMAHDLSGAGGEEIPGLHLTGSFIIVFTNAHYFIPNQFNAFFIFAACYHNL